MLYSPLACYRITGESRAQIYLPEGMAVGEWGLRKVGTKKGSKRREALKGRVTVFRAVSIRMLGFFALGHMMNVVHLIRRLETKQSSLC
jgi:hypothetical protein